MDTHELLTPDEAARRLRITLPTLTRWRRTGTIPSIRVNGTVIRYSWPDVLASLRDRSEDPSHA